MSSKYHSSSFHAHISLKSPIQAEVFEHAQATHPSTYWSPALHTTEFRSDLSDLYQTAPIVTCSSHLQAIPASLDKSISLVRMPAVEKV